MDEEVEIEALNNKVNSLNANPTSNASEIYNTLGRIVSKYNKIIKSCSDDATKEAFEAKRNSVKKEMKNAIKNLKKSDTNIVFQVAQEVRHKVLKAVENIREINQSNEAKDKIINSVKLAGNVISTGVSIAKVPVVATLKLVSMGMPTIGKIMIQPLQVPAYLFSKLIDPDGNYNNQKITNIGTKLGEMIGKAVQLTSKGIKRI